MFSRRSFWRFRIEFRDHGLAERLERVQVAEERRLGGHHRLDDLLLQAIGERRAQQADQVADRVQLQLAHDRRQPGLDQVLLAVLQDDRAALAEQLADEVEVLVRHGVEPFPRRKNGDGTKMAPGV